MSVLIATPLYSARWRNKYNNFFFSERLYVLINDSPGDSKDSGLRQLKFMAFDV